MKYSVKPLSIHNIIQWIIAINYYLYTIWLLLFIEKNLSLSHRLMKRTMLSIEEI